MRLRVAWPELLGDIEKALDDPNAERRVRLADHLEVPRSTLRGWRDRTTRPKHDEGERLIAKWCGLTGKGREAVPMERVMLSAGKMR